jgi:hypothetical protein
MMTGKDSLLSIVARAAALWSLTLSRVLKPFLPEVILEKAATGAAIC